MFDEHPPTTVKTERQATPAAIVGFVLLFCLVGLLLLHYMNKQRPVKEKPSPITQTQEAPAVQPEITAPASASVSTLREDQLKLATVGRGEGVEHALIRQLVADPSEYGFSGDVSNKRAVKKWAGRRAHFVAVRAGYFDWKFGAEIRVKHPGKTAFLLEKNSNGKFQVAEYKVSSHDGSGVSPEPQKTLTLASRTAHSEFLGWPGAHASIPVYEYLYTG
jgi:hypothetical protein